MSPREQPHLLCHRCGCDLHPGQGDFYVVKIEAYADPTPPEITTEDLSADATAEIERILQQVSGMSAMELMDEVHRRLVIHLCRTCYQAWIENPAGRSDT